jgi:hypothetical protein
MYCIVSHINKDGLTTNIKGTCSELVYYVRIATQSRHKKILIYSTLC